ncbi:YbaN family protein [Chloroflexota bacterium]
MLLAAICYMRGSQRLYNALLCNRFVGNYVRNYLEGRGMSLGMKIWTLTLLWVAIICTAMLATNSLIIRIILAVVLIGVTIHILLIKTMKKNTKPTNNLRP